MNKYPVESDMEFTVQQIVKMRNNEDIADRDNFNNIFLLGRKVGKVPTGSSDVDADDNEGDINYDASYVYILVNNSGTLVWRRATLGSW